MNAVTFPRPPGSDSSLNLWLKSTGLGMLEDGEQCAPGLARGPRGFLHGMSVTAVN